MDIFRRLDNGLVTKESIVLIFEKIMRKESKTVEEAIESLEIRSISTQELDAIIDKILEENMSVITQKQMASLGVLMGRSMAILRGKADGQKVNSILKEKLERLIKSTTDVKAKKELQQP